MDTIFIEAIEFYAFHGASDEEQAIGHRYAVDVELRFDIARAGASDDLRDTVSYAEVAARIVEIGTGMRCRLVETVAARMAERLLAEHAVESVRIRLRKLAPPMNVIAASAGVEIVRFHTGTLEAD